MIPTPKARIAILGAGSFATALVKIFSDNNKSEVFWWIRRPELLQEIRLLKFNPEYLSSVQILIAEDHISSNLSEIVRQADWILLAIPAAFLKRELIKLDPSLFKGKKIISVIKGMIPLDHQVVADYIHSNFEIPLSDIVVIAGPCHAEEIAQEKLSYLTIASQNLENSTKISQLLSNSYIRTQCSTDIYGTEYASVLKNIMSLASGIFHGLGYGDNFQAVFISNAIQEIARFLNRLHPMERDINDSAYLGDLLVTAYSKFSRNRTFGTLIGNGYSVASAQLEMNMIAEGYYASASIHYIIEKNSMKMPILEAVYRILHKGVHPGLELKKLTSLLH